MPELLSQRNNYKCFEVREASLKYGDEFLTDTSSIDQPYLGAWCRILEPQQYLSKQRFTYCNTPAAPVDPESIAVPINKWPENRTPFTQRNLVDREEELIQELILRFKTSLSVLYLESLTSRLITLYHDAKDEDAASPGITVGSLLNFYNFFQLHENINCPTISLTPENNIYASWRIEQNRLFSVHFLPNRDVRFVIFKPNARHPERQIRVSGTVTTDMLRETVACYGVWEWISE